MYKYLLLIFIIIFLYCFMSDYNIENFSDTNIRDQENYNWSAKWNDLDYKAREDAVCTPIKKEMREFGTVSAWIWTVPNSCENGLPHTRNKNVIAMPNGWSDEDSTSTLLHESVHLFQRNFSNDWEKFYNNQWNYEIFEEPAPFIPKELIQKRRSNPDTDDKPWCRWNKRWWSVPIYDDSDNPRLNQTPIIWYDEKENKMLDKPPNEWLTFFGPNINQIEHPNEISAVLITNKNSTCLAKNKLIEFVNSKKYFNLLSK